MAAMVTRTRLLRLYVHCLTCFRYDLQCEHTNLSEVTDAENKITRGLHVLLI